MLKWSWGSLQRVRLDAIPLNWVFLNAKVTETLLYRVQYRHVPTHGAFKQQRKEKSERWNQYDLIIFSKYHSSAWLKLCSYLWLLACKHPWNDSGSICLQSSLHPSSPLPASSHQSLWSHPVTHNMQIMHTSNFGAGSAQRIWHSETQNWTDGNSGIILK